MWFDEVDVKLSNCEGARADRASFFLGFQDDGGNDFLARREEKKEKQQRK